MTSASSARRSRSIQLGRTGLYLTSNRILALILAILTDQLKRDLLEILDDRYDKKSTLITSQLSVEDWHGYLNEPTPADAILDRLVHNAYRLTLRGESMRKQKTLRQENKPAAT